jgi:hypothetical protein
MKIIQEEIKGWYGVVCEVFEVFEILKNNEEGWGWTVVEQVFFARQDILWIHISTTWNPAALEVIEEAVHMPMLRLDHEPSWIVSQYK